MYLNNYTISCNKDSSTGNREDMLDRELVADTMKFSCLVPKMLADTLLVTMIIP